LGGGAGSGAAPIFAKISKELGNMTYGIFTLPFSFEGEKKTRIALSSLERMKPYLNAYTCIPNERIFQIIDKKTPLKTALSLINKSLTDGLGGLIKMIYEPGLINIDFADLRTVLEFDSPSSSRKGKLAYLNTIETQRKEGGAKEAVEKVISSPLYPYTIRGAKGILLDIGGEKNLSLDEVNQISKSIHDLVDKEAKIIFGISQSKQYRDKIKTTLLAVGCGQRAFSRKKKIKKKVKKIKLEIPEKKEVKVIKKKRKKRAKKVLPLKKIQRVKKTTIPKKAKVKVLKKAPLSFIPPKETETKVKVRKNALQLRREAEEAERKMLAQEKIWETPAFLRKKLEKNYD